MIRKPILFTLIVLFALMLSVYVTTAQEPEPSDQAGNLTGTGDSWSLTGNAGTDPVTNFLGTTDGSPFDPRPLVFKASGWEVMRLDSFGGEPRVGIGTSNPASQLHVGGFLPTIYIDDISGNGAAFLGFLTMGVERAVLRGTDSGELMIKTGTPPQTHMIINAAGNVRLIGPGDLGAGARLNFGDANYVYLEEDEDDKLTLYGRTRIALMGGKVGIGTTGPETPLHIRSNRPYVRFEDTDGGNKWQAGVFGQDTDFRITEIVDGSPESRLVVEEGGNVGIGVTDPQWRLHVDGTTSTDVLHIRAGLDLAEPFEVVGAENVELGMVVAIDAEHPGQLRIADKAYDRAVAGVVSGAGGIKPGLIMQQEGALMAGSHPVALTGRVYVLADASNGAIQPGDLLTTSDIPGHAMKVTDYARAQGSILGKAMSKLDEGTGLVLVLVTLQ